MDGVAGEKKYTTDIRTSHKGMVGPDLLFTRIRFTQNILKFTRQPGGQSDIV